MSGGGGDKEEGLRLFEGKVPRGEDGVDEIKNGFEESGRCFLGGVGVDWVLDEP
jgi:hypothetical protein